LVFFFVKALTERNKVLILRDFGMIKTNTIPRVHRTLLDLLFHHTSNKNTTQLFATSFNKNLIDMLDVDQRIVVTGRGEPTYEVEHYL